MKLTFEGSFDNRKAASVIVYPKLPSRIWYSGYVEFEEGLRPTFHMSIGDYILVTWTQGGIAQFDKYGSYGNGVLMDSLRAEDLDSRFFEHAVGVSFSPCAVASISDTAYAVATA